MKFFRKPLWLFFSLCTLVSQAQTNRLFLAGGRGSEKFNTVFQLSDSTVLIGGEANNLSWLPAGTSIITLDTLAGQAPRSVSPNSMGFILHVSKDLSQILRAVRLPANTLESINRIKTTSKPGDPTGEIYFSGRRGGSQSGYYIGRLDQNFVNGLPTRVAMGINIFSGEVSTGGKHSYDGPSYHRLFQPWDVDADGHVLAATGEEFEFDWATVDKFNRNGRPDSVEFFPRQLVRLDGGSQWPAVTGRVVEIAYRTASNLPDSVWVRVVDNPAPEPDVFDSVKVAGTAGANVMLKTYRVGGLRSTNSTDFETLSTDENGNPGRKHRFTEDYLFSSFCGPQSCETDGPGYLGYSMPNIWTGRVGDIAIDRRNGDMYFTYTIPTTASPSASQTQPLGKASSYDMQPVLVAMQKNGQIKWWARLMKEAFAGNSADQITDGLAIDYAFNSLVILGRVYDTCTNNYWRGNEIALNPGGNGFQNSWTGSNPKIEYSWLGKYDLNSGRIRYATYVAENAKNTTTGALLNGPLYDNWPNPNNGNPTLAETVTPLGGRTLDVDAQGNVYLLSTTKGRPITTGNAYQKMLKPDLGGSTDSLPAAEVSFVRVYSPTLNGLVYSSVVAGVWNPQDSSASNPIGLTGIVPTGNGFYLVGSHTGKNVAAESVPLATLNPPAWANDSMRQTSGLIGLHKYGTTSFIPRPSAISGPASHCPGETRTYSVNLDPNATQGYQWVLPGANWSIVGPANGNSVQIKYSGSQGGQLRVVAKNNNGVSEASYLNIPNTIPPPTVNTSGFVCATGGTATLTANGGSTGNYRWYADSTTTIPIPDAFDGTYQVSTITATTRFFVAIVGPNGCETDRRGVNARYGKASPVIVPLPANGPPYNALQSFPTSLPAGVTRSWRKDGNPLGTGAVVTLSGVATYSLCFTNACGDSCVTYTVTGLPDLLEGLNIQVYPNPTSGNLNLLIAGENKETIRVRITDVLGRSVSQDHINRKKDLEEFSMETAGLQPGVYFLNLQTSKGRQTIRFIKQ